jgi:hypothetical protein
VLLFSFLEQVGQMMQRDLISGLETWQAWNKNQVNLAKVAKVSKHKQVHYDRFWAVLIKHCSL